MTLSERLGQFGISVDGLLASRDLFWIYKVLPLIQGHPHLYQAFFFTWLKNVSEIVACLRNENSESPDDDYLAEALCEVVRMYKDVDIGD